MYRKMVAICVSFLIILSSIVILVEIADRVEAPATHYVGGAGPGNYSKIQWAIDNASDGDTVFVYNGTYYEDIIVNKTISLIGENKFTTKINGSSSGDVVYVEMNWVNITGFTITGSGPDLGDAGIQLNNVQECKIDNNNISNNCYGIYLIMSSNNTINDCWLSNISMFGSGICVSSSEHILINNCTLYNIHINGIRLLHSSNVIIMNSSVTNGYYGFTAYKSPNNTIINSTFKDNTLGFELSLSKNNTLKNTSISNSMYNLIINGIELYDFYQDIEDTNKVNDKPIYYIIGQSGLEFNETMSIGYLGLVSCDDIIVKNLSISENGHTVLLVNTSNSLIDNVICLNNRWGVYLWNSQNNIVSNCSFDFNYLANIGIASQSINNTIYNCTLENNPNQYGGILIEDSQNNQILQNTIYNNKYGIYIAGSSSNNIIESNTVTWNDFNGIYLYSTSNNSILNNNISSNIQRGIQIFQSSSNIIANNSIYSNNNCGIDQYNSNSNIMNNNSISNHGIGIILESSNSNAVEDNSIYSSTIYGIQIYQASSNMIANNTISNGRDGIYLYISSLNNEIQYNDICNNTKYGIWVDSSSNNNIIANNVMNNTEGFHLQMSSRNRIYHNNIINNSIQAYDDMDDNIWNDSYPSGGNYWSDFDETSEGAYDEYQGPDQDVLGNDGIVDNGTILGGGRNPFIIDSDSQDNYPLVQPYGKFIYLFPGWNLISIPQIYLESDPSVIFKSIKDSYDAVQWFNPTDINDQWKHFHLFKPQNLNDLDNLNQTMGIWIHITNTNGVLYKYPGIEPSVSQKINLNTGWNMVGYPSLSNHNRTVGLNNLTFGPDIDCIQWYDAGAKTWHFMGPDDFFVPGRGYWMHSKVEAVWEVPL